MASTDTVLAGYSSYLGVWTVRPMTAGVQLVSQRGYALYEDGSDLIAYSPGTGSFEVLSPTGPYTVTFGHYVAAVAHGSEVSAYSSGQNRFATRTFQSSYAIDIDDEILVVIETNEVTAFSIVRGEFSAPVQVAAASVSLGDAVAFADNGIEGYAYSTVQNTWTAAPGFGSGVNANVLRNVVVLEDVGGYTGFSGRSGQWARQDVTVPFDFSAPSSGDMFVAFDGSDTYVFDPIIVRWAQVGGPAPIQSFDIWRQTFVGTDGSSLFGFGRMNNVWSTIPMKGGFLSLDANSSCGYVETDTHLYACSAHGSLSTFSRFPEFSRLQPIAAPLHLLQAAPAGSRVIAALGLSPVYLPGTALGTLFLDPATVFARIPLGTIPATGVLDATLDLSGSPSLRGSALHIQNVVVPLGGMPWITNSIAPVIL